MVLIVNLVVLMCFCSLFFNVQRYSHNVFIICINKYVIFAVPQQDRTNPANIMRILTAINLSDTFRFYVSVLGLAQDFGVQFYRSRTCVLRRFLRTAKSFIVSVLPSIRPSARIEQSRLPTGKIFMRFDV